MAFIWEAKMVPLNFFPLCMYGTLCDSYEKPKCTLYKQLFLYVYMGHYGFIWEARMDPI